MLQLEDEGKLDYRTVPKALKGYRRQWKKWKRLSGFKPIWIEEKFISSLGFAGIIDRTGSFGRGSMAVVDVKTGDVADWVGLQLCFYTLAVDNRPSIARTIRRIAVSVKPDKYSVREFPMSSWDTSFAKCMAALHEVKNGSH
jgi:hypothetical protein